MSLILGVGWVWTLEKNVTKLYVTNWEGRVGKNPNMYNVTLFSLFLFELFPNGVDACMDCGMDDGMYGKSEILRFQMAWWHVEWMQMGQ